MSVPVILAVLEKLRITVPLGSRVNKFKVRVHEAQLTFASYLGHSRRVIWQLNYLLVPWHGQLMTTA